MPGYKNIFVHTLLNRHKCPLCQLAMRDPMQTECGHLFCKECLEPVLKEDRPLCPLDKEPISKDGVFPDNACRREILNLEVECGCKGCKWRGKLRDHDEHTVVCDYVEVKCTQCGCHVQRMELQGHQKTSCLMRPELCVHCEIKVPFQKMQTHLAKECPEVLRSCPNKCDPKVQMKLAELEKHLSPEEGDCPLAKVKCPYSVFNCTYLSLRQNIKSHLEQFAVHHAQLHAQHHQKLTQSVEKIKMAQQHLTERVMTVEQQVSSTEQRLTGMEQRIGATSAGAVSSAHTDPVKFNGASVFSSSPTLQQFEVLNSKVTELDQNLDRCLSSSLDQELRLQLLERATYNGILLWKVDDFARRRREAVEGVTLSLYSTPFYTSRHGYKMCARVYLNGDGLGKGTHLSFFFVVMRGPFDALLTWPFKQKVMLTLLNQVGKKHITDHFRPDPASSSFQRPGRKEMNIASGCPMFIRVDHLLSGGFVKDDTIFLRVVVDTTDLPKVFP